MRLIPLIMGNMKHYNAKIQLKDAESAKSERRFRNILANSGKIMESGEIRELEDLYVMGYDSELYKISELNKDPEKQTEKYAVKAQADHGELIDGELIPTIEKQFGSCRVWLEEDGLHARMYFANDDKLADHAWAISEDASYSTGIDWYPEGYYGTGYEIDQAIGILREVSMVLTGNDPRAKTIDTKKLETEAQGSVEGGDGEIKDNKEKNQMGKTNDELTREERDGLVEQLAGVVDGFTARDEAVDEKTADDVEPEKAEEKVEESKDSKVLHQNIIVVRDSAVRQPTTASKDSNWLTSKDAKRRFADLAYQTQGFKGYRFEQLWQDELQKHGVNKTADGITGLGLPVDGRQIVIDALEKSEGLISHFDFIGGKTYLVKLISAAEGNDAESARAGGHKKGDTKLFQQLKNDPRSFYNVPVYKKLDIDYLELYENPELIDVRARELVEARIVEIERAMVIGDGRTAPEEGSNTPDRRMFRDGRGFYSMVADAADTNGIGSLFATEVEAPAGSNLYDASTYAEGALRAEGRRIIVAKKQLITDFRLARLDGTTGNYVLPAGQSLEAALGAARIYTPAWMDNADCDFVMFVENKPKVIGMNPASPDMKAFFDTTTDVDVLMAEGPNGGGLADYKAAAVVTIAEE